MRWLCVVGAWESRRATDPRGRPPGLLRRRFSPMGIFLVADFGLKLARLRDQLLDGLFGRQNANEFALGIHFLHVLRRPRPPARPWPYPCRESACSRRHWPIPAIAAR